jgi:hypothetical protein
VSVASGFVVILGWCVGVAASTTGAEVSTASVAGALAPSVSAPAVALAPSASAETTTVGAAALAPQPTSGALEPEAPERASPDPSGRGVLSRMLPEGFTLTTYAELNFTWDTTQPKDGVINLRGFDARHASFSISNVVVDLGWDWQNVVGRIALQAGITGETYYTVERTRLPGGRLPRDTWRHIQQGYVGYRLPVLSGLLVTAGLFLSPIGPEGIAVKDQWAWSRSNLFFGLPFYHLGARAELALDTRWTATLGIVNGWNAAVDGDEDKSLLVRLAYADEAGRSLSALYLVGTEDRLRRHLFDGYGTFPVVDRLWVQAHVNGGLVDGSPRAWFGAALALRCTILEPSAHELTGLWLALRGDVLRETALSPRDVDSLFFGASWVSSVTGTVELRPSSGLSVRLEGRLDRAANPIFGVCSLGGEGCAMGRSTLTLGVTAWL